MADLRGPAPSGPKRLLPADVKFIAIHCSATPPALDVGVKEIDKWHRLRGFQSCGYHFVIRRDGTVEAGRDLGVRGAHIENHNHEAIGVCLVGGVDETKLMKPQANFTKPQLAAMKVLVNHLLQGFPGAKVQGHRDFPGVAKACPSFDVKTFFNTGKLI